MSVQRIASLILGVSGLVLVILSYLSQNVMLLIIGILVILLSIFTIAFFMVMDLYQKDQEFNKEELLKQGLTIITCNHCDTENVKEDKYCRNCGETFEE